MCPGGSSKPPPHYFLILNIILESLVCTVGKIEAVRVFIICR